MHGSDAAVIDLIVPNLQPEVRRNTTTIRVQPRPQAPQVIKELVEWIQARKYEFEQTIRCPSCTKRVLHLQKLDFVWPYATTSVTFPGILAYHCYKCDETHFPEEVLIAMAEVVDELVEQMPTERPRHNPRARAFAQNYSRR